MSHHRMDDAAYKRLFCRSGMVRDLLRGFAARDWSEALDFASLTPLPASYVSRDLQQRHGDLVGASVSAASSGCIWCYCSSSSPGSTGRWRYGC